MSKYIDAERLKEKIYAEDTVSLAHGSLPEFDQGCHHAFLTVLSFIDSLQQNQPEIDLNEEIYFWIKGGGLIYPMSSKEENNIKDTAIHFFELGLNAKK